jgi:hypothetical protein
MEALQQAANGIEHDTSYTKREAAQYEYPRDFNTSEEKLDVFGPPENGVNSKD